MQRFAFTIALPLLAAACAPDRTTSTASDGTEASLASATSSCAAGSVLTQLHADFPDGTSADVDDCFASKAMSAIDGAEGDFWNGHFLDFRLTSPDGATSVYFHSLLEDVGLLQSGADLALPSQRDWMRLSLRSAHGSQEGGLGTLHLDEWKLPSLDKSDGLLSATITTTLKASDGSETKVRLKVTGIVLDSFFI